MKQTALLIFVLSHAGYWLSGSPATIHLAWAAPVKIEPSVLDWSLQLGNLTVLSGRSDLPNAEKPVEISFPAPSVRVRTTMNWNYRLVSKHGGNVVETGSIATTIFPSDLVADYSLPYAGIRVILIDKTTALGGLLSKAKIPFRQIQSVSQLGMERPDVVLVASDTLEQSPFDDGKLLRVAQSGAQVLVLRQSRVQSVVGYRLASRTIATNFQWRTNHPLLAGFDTNDMISLITEHQSALAIQLPPDEPALELGYWPAESPGADPSPIDALLLTRRCGSGRIVLCQLPLEDFKNDPRCLMFLNNALSYLTTRPQATPRPSERGKEPASRTEKIPEIILAPITSR